MLKNVDISVHCKPNIVVCFEYVVEFFEWYLNWNPIFAAPWIFFLLMHEDQSVSQCFMWNPCFVEQTKSMQTDWESDGTFYKSVSMDLHMDGQPRITQDPHGPGFFHRSIHPFHHSSVLWWYRNQLPAFYRCHHARSK